MIEIYRKNDKTITASLYTDVNYRNTADISGLTTMMYVYNKAEEIIFQVTGVTQNEYQIEFDITSTNSDIEPGEYYYEMIIEDTKRITFKIDDFIVKKVISSTI